MLAELGPLRRRIAQLSGSLVATCDGLLVAHDLPPDLEPAGMAALAASELSLSHQMMLNTHDGDFDEVVIRGTGGYVVIYAAGPHASLTLLAGPEVNVGRLHLEARPVARTIADHLADSTHPLRNRRNAHVQSGNGAEGDDGDRRGARMRRR
ncbi:roadblock/LC7 domain-containing protein [Actinomadura scrupuli]|uniref:roadblock/LC7 domain-containing protein n=1 Tax=Actinomadura scrupuli TaxID=559629 RepID=UPI003D97456A